MRIFYLTIVLIFADQITKILVKGFSISFLNINFKGMELYQSIDLMGSFLRLTYIENPGMAFGLVLFGDNSTLYLSVFTLLASIGLLIYLIKSRQESLLIRLPIAIILAGAVGNLIDRIFYDFIYHNGVLFKGKVVDFIDFDFFDIASLHLSRWPIFNFADIYVSVGVVLLFVFNMILEHRKKKEEELQLLMDEAKKQEEAQRYEMEFPAQECDASDQGIEISEQPLPKEDNENIKIKTEEDKPADDPDNGEKSNN